jgi:Coenzyme PQQ synthesis protein D (PqqD)
MKETRPRARTEGLIMRRLDGEVLVYDRAGDRATCLNPFAADVWERCDGQTTPAALARAVAASRSQAVDERAVRLALDQLSRARLLESGGESRPSAHHGASRRELLRTFGVGAAVAIPMVTSIVVPGMADAQSCFPEGANCTSDGDCCSFNCNMGVCGPPLFRTQGTRTRRGVRS